MYSLLYIDKKKDLLYLSSVNSNYIIDNFKYHVLSNILTFKKCRLWFSSCMSDCGVDTHVYFIRNRQYSKRNFSLRDILRKKKELPTIFSTNKTRQIKFGYIVPIASQSYYLGTFHGASLNLFKLTSWVCDTNTVLNNRRFCFFSFFVSNKHFLKS